jgi:hypothetical protein
MKYIPMVHKHRDMQSRTSLSNIIASGMAWPIPPKEVQTKAELEWDDAVVKIRKLMAEREGDSGDNQIVRTLGVYCGFKTDETE